MRDDFLLTADGRWINTNFIREFRKQTDGEIRAFFYDELVDYAVVPEDSFYEWLERPLTRAAE